MGKEDKRVDAYIARSADFAKPILNHLRSLVHEGCPDVEETIKWGFPHFDYHGIMASMAAFKQHCSFGFWKASLLTDPEGRLSGMGETSMGHFGKITQLKHLPGDKILLRYIKEAAKLNEEGVRVERKPPSKEKKTFVVPDYFKKALSRNKKAFVTFQAFSYSHKKDYVEWVTEAKTKETRDRRIGTSLELLSEGKSRNWKYQKK